MAIPKRQYSKKRQTVQLNSWVSPQLKEAVVRLARTHNLSISKLIATFLEKMVHQEIQTQYADLLQPMVKKAVRQQNRPLAWLLIRTAFDTEVTLQLMSNFLRLHPATAKSYPTTLDNSIKTAKHNILRKIPDLTNIIEEVDKWMAKEAEKEDKGGRH